MAVMRFGLIGCGPMGRDLAKHLREVSETAVVAVSDPADDARQQAAQAHNAQAYTEYPELLSREDVDAVIIATPTHLHKEITIAAAQAGKHVFCEKPMALTIADCDAMIAAADRAGVKLVIGQVLRLLYPFARIAELAREDELGIPVAVDIARYNPWSPRAGWRRRMDQSGGPLYELNVHELDFMRHLCGEVAQVSAAGGNYLHPDLDFPDVFFITLKFRSGAVGRLRGGGASLIQRYIGEVICPRGTLWWDRNEGKQFVCRPGAEPESLDATPWTKPNGYVWELGSFVEWVRRGTAPVVTAQDGRAAVELAEATYRSMESGKPIDLPLR